MLTTIPIRSTTAWTKNAKNAEVKLHKDTFLKRRQISKFTPDLI